MTSEYHAAFLADVRRHIADVEAKLAELRTVEHYLVSHPDHDEAIESNQIEERKLPIANFTQIDAAVAILRAAGGRPLKTPAIVRKMIQSGYPASDSRKLKLSVFSAMSRRTDLFRKAGPGLWTLVESNGSR